MVPVTPSMKPAVAPRMSEGNADPIVSRSPASTHCPSRTTIWVRLGTAWECSRTGWRTAPVPMSSTAMYSGSMTMRWAAPGRLSSSSMRIQPSVSATSASAFGLRASKSSTTRGRPCVMSAPETPPVWNVRMVSWVPGSPIDWAAMMPTASPGSQSLPEAGLRP